MEKKKLLYFLKNSLIAVMLCASLICNASVYNSIVGEIESKTEKNRHHYEALLAENEKRSRMHDHSYEQTVQDIESKTEKNKSHYKSLIAENQKQYLKTKPEIKKAVKQAQDAFKAHAQSLKIDKKDKGSIIDQIVQNAKNLDAQKQANKPRGIIVFVSFAMPKSLLLSYYKQVQLYGGRLVIRGLIENSFKKTITAMGVDKNNIPLKAREIPIMDINPKLFRNYKVTRVPTILLSHKGKTDKFTGSVSLKYALDEASQKGDCGKFASSILAKVNNQSKERT